MKMIMVGCLTCGVVFERQLYEYQRHPRAFCSRPCYRQRAGDLPGRNRSRIGVVDGKPRETGAV